MSGGWLRWNDPKWRLAGQVRFVVRFVFRPSLFSTICSGSFLGSFFPQLRVFNNFSASFLGSFRFVFGGQTFVFYNFSGSFSKKGILFYFSVLKPEKNDPLLPISPAPRVADSTRRPRTVCRTEDRPYSQQGYHASPQKSSKIASEQAVILAQKRSPAQAALLSPLRDSGDSELKLTPTACAMG